MPLTEEQKEAQKQYDYKIYPKMRVIRDSPEFVYLNGKEKIKNPNPYKKGDIVKNYRSFGSMICWDENGTWYSFYDLEIVK